ncbi:hypothetical protein [Kocuria nitroreducens]|uniref:hypothetical protein n=1 Tax=Kocuria nitroreducens TaxID=3058914 RepID=UPI0036DD118A
MTAPRPVHAPTFNDHDAAATQQATPRLSRYRLHTDRPGLSLRAGEVILGTPYESVESALVVLVRCETDGHNPGVVLLSEELEDLGPTAQLLGPCSWGKLGARS